MNSKQAKFAKRLSEMALQTQTEPRDALVVFGHMAGLLVAHEMNVMHRSFDEAVTICRDLFDEGMILALAEAPAANNTTNTHHH